MWYEKKDKTHEVKENKINKNPYYNNVISEASLYRGLRNFYESAPLAH